MKKLLISILLILSAFCAYAQNIDTELLKRAEAGDAEAQFDVGMNFYDSKDYKNAMEWFSKSANQGYIFAQNNLGAMYYNGAGVPQDYKQAFKWYSEAANKGNSRAQSNLGVMYASGHGVQQDYNQAFEWFLKSARNGDIFAQLNLGFMYYNGDGVPQDYSKAIEWYSKAAYKGNVDAQLNLGVMFVDGEGTQPDVVTGCAWIYITKNVKSSAQCDSQLTSNQMMRVLNMKDKILNQISSNTK